MNRKSFLVGLLAAGCFVATSTLVTSPGNAQADPKVAKAMAALKAERALGTILDPKGKAIANINKGEAFYGEVDILGKPYVTGYDPIKDASGKVIGIWYVGYEK